MRVKFWLTDCFCFLFLPPSHLKFRVRPLLGQNDQNSVYRLHGLQGPSFLMSEKEKFIGILQMVHVQLNATTVFGVKNETIMYHLSDSNFHQTFCTNGI